MNRRQSFSASALALVPIIFYFSVGLSPFAIVIAAALTGGWTLVAALSIAPLLFMAKCLRLFDRDESVVDCGGKGSSKTICVIGAGPSGLVTSKELVAAGHRVECFEASGSLGGAFAHSAFDSCELTSSPPITSFSDVPVGDRVHWTKDEYVDYLQQYARHFGLLTAVHFQRRVVQVVDNGKRQWLVTIRDESDGSVSIDFF